MEAHLAPNSSIQVNNIVSSCEICSGPHDTQYCMKNPEQAFVDYASSRNNEVGGKQFTTNQGPRNFNEATNAWNNTITIISKEDEPSEAGIVETNLTEDNDHNAIVEVEEKVGEEISGSEAVIEEAKSREIEQDNLGDRTCRNTKEVEEVGEWIEYEEPFDLVDTRDESVYESLIEKMPSCSLSFDFKIEKGDPSNLKIMCMIGRKFIANAYINLDSPMNLMSLACCNTIRNQGVKLSKDDFRRGYEMPSDLKNGFYKDVDKHDSSYREEFGRIDLDLPLENNKSGT
ncbi:hypothetical protein Tco_0793118 [Tanacetum coccineum]